MAPEKSTIMVLKVDLECSNCYKKVKKVLCEFPQIRDQLYDEKTNTVTITVVCCSPEKIRDKLCCKGGPAIKSIEIKKSPPPKPTDPPEKLPTEEKPKEPEKQKVCHVDVVATIKLPDRVNGYSPQAYPQAFPFMPCCGQCYHGYSGGPCHQGLGRPVPPPPEPCYDGYGYGGNRACYVTRCDYFNEENPSGCSIM